MTDQAPTPDATTTADVEAHRMYSDENLKTAITKLEDALAQLRGLKAGSSDDVEAHRLYSDEKLRPT